jgi:MFS family permease
MGAQARRVVGLVTGGHLLSHFYLLAFPPLFPLLRADLGLTNVELGLIMSAVSAGTVLQLPVGELVDRTGAKLVFVAGVAVTAGGVALAGLGVAAYPSLLAGALVSGVGQAAFHPADYALLGAATDGDREGRSFGVHTFGAYVGFAAAPVVVAGVAGVAGARAALLAVGAVGVGYAALAAVALPPVYRDRVLAATGTDDGGDTEPAADGAGRRSLRADLLRRDVLAMFAFFVVFVAAAKGVQTFTNVLTVDAYGFGAGVGNAALTAFFAAAAVGILTGGYLADRLPPKRVALATLVGSAVLIVAVVTVVAPLGPPFAVAGFGAVGFTVGLVYPSRDRLVSRATAAGGTGRGFGFVFSGVAVGGVVGPAVLGWTVDTAGAVAAFLVVAALYAASAGVTTLVRASRPA